MNQRTVYAWTGAAKPGMVAWALGICIVVGTGVTSLRAFADVGAATQIVLILLGVSFAGVTWLGRLRCEAWIGDGQLVFRSRPVFGAWLNRPWTERRITRESICAFTLDQNPSTERKLTIRLDDGSSLRILESDAYARSDAFESFLAAFRSFVRADLSAQVEERVNAWRLPIVPALAGGIVVAMGVSAVLSVSGLTDQPSAVIVVIGGLMVAVAGVRFFLKYA